MFPSFSITDVSFPDATVPPSGGRVRTSGYTGEIDTVRGVPSGKRDDWRHVRRGAYCRQLGYNIKDSLSSLLTVFYYFRLQRKGDSLTVGCKCNAYFPAKPLVNLFGGDEKGIKQLITLMYCFRGDLPNLANIVGTYCLGGFSVDDWSLFTCTVRVPRTASCIGFYPRSGPQNRNKLTF